MGRWHILIRHNNTIMTQETFKTTVLRPSPGHYLTQAADVDINDRMIA